MIICTLFLYSCTIHLTANRCTNACMPVSASEYLLHSMNRGYQGQRYGAGGLKPPHTFEKGYIKEITFYNQCISVHNSAPSLWGAVAAPEYRCIDVWLAPDLSLIECKVYLCILYSLMTQETYTTNCQLWLSLTYCTGSPLIQLYCIVLYCIIIIVIQFYYCNCRGLRNTVSSCCFSPNGHYLCLASWDKMLRVYDVALGTFRTKGPVVLPGHEGCVSSCTYSNNGMVGLYACVSVHMCACLCV